jgi:hypothetical protein
MSHTSEKAPPAEGAPRNVSSSPTDVLEIAQNTTRNQERNPVAVAAAIKDLTLEYAVEAAWVASVSARHFVENIEIGRVVSAEADMACACRHLTEAARMFREWQGKPLSTRGTRS